MDETAEGGIVLSPADCKALFPRLKNLEPYLDGPERSVLLRMEKFLYGVLPLDEIEELVGNPPELPRGRSL
jgi:hypothetical protein